MPKQSLKRTLEEVDFSSRTFNSLKQAGFQTVADIVRLSDRELLFVPLLGRRGVNEVKELLAYMGLRLAEPKPILKQKRVVGFNLRVPHDLHSAVKEAADLNNRSINGEIADRLKRTFTEDAVLDMVRQELGKHRSWSPPILIGSPHFGFPTYTSIAVAGSSDDKLAINQDSA